jgi:uncharacterized protein (TIGR02996 family)
MTDPRPELLRFICDHPADDHARLVYADACEEAGDAARGEFIRCQIELVEYSGKVFLDSSLKESRYDILRRRERELLVRLHGGGDAFLDVQSMAIERDGVVMAFRRGFVAEVSCTLSGWLGSQCLTCRGSGGFRGFCAPCGGTGLVGGHGPEIVRSQPVEVVRATDKRPGRYMGSYAWFRVGGVGEERSQLPDQIFDLIPLAHRPTEADANAALSAALLAWARNKNKEPVT